MTRSLATGYRAALDYMARTGPRPLHRLAALEVPKASDEALHDYLVAADADDELRKALHLTLATWDGSSEPWVGDTQPNTDERRVLILDQLSVDDRVGKLFAELFPIADRDGDIVIAAEEWTPWYSDAVRKERDFYWRHYRELLERKGWAPATIAALDRSTTEVVERLSDPTRGEPYQAKGLVVGYVQSGKTANFTGVVARAIDAGYRLVVVLTGTTNLLRAQTQRRLDMELIGVENILGGVDPENAEALHGVDYQQDSDWLAGNFLRHGVHPADVGYPAIHRLTSFAGDYKSLKQGIEALNFPKHDRALPFHHPVNINNSDAKIAVVKKNASVLRKFVRDLGKITARLGDIPVLIIDDESDQASVNTSNPKKWVEDQKERTAINRLISQLLGMLPRAQYVGYTATPFANVFIDPSDAEDIFPSDFLIALGRPPGYMGASDFHDLLGEPDEGQDLSSRRAHVRIVDDQEEDDRLLEAIDHFVLAGAVKLYREQRGVGVFRHHTMLVHEAMGTSVHRDQAERIRQLWRTAGYYSVSSRARLRQLFEADLRRWAGRAGEDVPTPASFDELLPTLSEAVARIGDSGNPVLVVNSDRDTETEELDFDHRSVWRILVGGNKLARGFTVEGLTVSYFRRRTTMADAMMQMGRWFGFRSNYRDLVRLYTTDRLYEAFEAAILDEEYFRAEIRRYATLVDDKPQVTPRQIPPLVSQHLPWLKPTATNKMYNAILTERQSPGVPIEPTGYPDDTATITRNTERFRPILEAANRKVALHSSTKGRYEAWVGDVQHGELLDVLGSLTWLDEDYFKPDLRWLRRLGPEQVEVWTVIFPQLIGADDANAFLLRRGPLSLFRRERRRDPYFGPISDAKHRHAADRIAGVKGKFDDPVAAALAGPRRGAMLLYPVISPRLPKTALSGGEIDPGDVVMAFRLTAPKDARTSDRRLVRFAAWDSRNEKAPIVDVGRVR